MQRQHRITEDALKLLKKALSVTVEDYPQLNKKDALEKHFVYIQKILQLNHIPEQIHKQIDAYMDELKIKK